MVRARAKRRTLKSERVFERVISIPSDKIILLVVSITVAVVVSISLVVLGMKSFKLKEENRWIAEKIEQKRMEIQHLRSDISELLSSFQIVKVDGE